MGWCRAVLPFAAAVAAALIAAPVLAARVTQDATIERLRLESELLAAVHALAAPEQVEPLLERIHTAALAPRMQPPLVHLAVERALELARARGDGLAIARRLSTRALPPPTRALLLAAVRELGEPVPGLVPRTPGRPSMERPVAESAVVFVVDGLRKDILDSMLAAGRLPNVRKHLLDRGLTVDRMVSVFPTVTPPNAATMLTGVLPDRHKIPALAWYDGTAGTARLYTSVRARDVNHDLPASESTLWEYLRDRHQVATVGMPIERGAWYRWFHLFYPDRSLSAVGARYLDHAGWMPPVLGMWFLDLDAASHLGGTFAPAAEQCLERLDRELGTLCQTLIHRGTYDRTLLIWASDHGSQPTLQNVDVVGDLARAGLACRTLDLKIDPFVPKAMELRLRGAPAVCVNLGAGSGSLYLKPAQHVPDVEAALRAYPGGVDVLAALTAHPAVDVAAFAQGPGLYRVVSASGAGEIESRRTAAGFESRWHVTRGVDPLGVAVELHQKWLGLSDWVAATADSPRPAAVPGLAAFLASGRGGDVVFTARPGVNFSKHFHTRGGYHGGLTHGEAVTRLMMAGPGVPHARVAAASMADVTPTVLALLEAPHDPARLDGRSILAPRPQGPLKMPPAPLTQVPGIEPALGGLALPGAPPAPLSTHELITAEPAPDAERDDDSASSVREDGAASSVREDGAASSVREDGAASSVREDGAASSDREARETAVALDDARARRPGADRGDASGDRARLGYSVDPRLQLVSLCRVPDWRLDARGDTAPWWPLLLPAAMTGTAVQVDFRRPAGRADVVASPGLVRTEFGVKPGDRVYPTFDLRAAAPLVDGRRAWLGVTGGAGLLTDGERFRGRADAGVLVTCELTRRWRAFGFAGPFTGSVGADRDASGLRLKSGVEVYTGGRGSAILEAVRDADVSRVSAVVNLPAF